MKENINKKTEKNFFKKSYLTKTKRAYSSYKHNKGIEHSLLYENNNSFFNPLTKRNILGIKTLLSKFIINKNKSSFLHSSNLSCINKDNKKICFNLNDKKIDKNLFYKYISLLNNSKDSSNYLKNENKKNSFNKYKLLKNNNSYKELINRSNINKKTNEELLLENKKNELKKRLNKDIQKNIIIDKKTLQEYNILFKIGLRKKLISYIKGVENDVDESINNNNSYKKNYSPKNIKLFKINNNYYNCFFVYKTTFRYEDYHYSPLEFLQKFYNKDEIMLMKSYPAFFRLNKSPFKEADLIFKPTLLQVLEYEDKMKNQQLNKTVYANKKLNKNNVKTLIKEKSKDKKINKGKLIKMNTMKNKEKKKIKYNPKNNEREIDPNEGTIEYFDQKFEKYMNNKKDRLMHNIESYKYKKNKFEFLKNEHTQKMEAELEMQRKTRPILESIRKNYIASNYLINQPKIIFNE